MSAGESSEQLAAAPALDIVALDDDADFREYLRSVLGTDGHSVRACATREEMIAAIEEKMPDVVFLDMKMGRTSGEDVLEELRRRWPKLVVIVLTGYPSMESMRRMLRPEGAGGTTGAFDYLAKPFSLADLRRTLASAAAAHQLGLKPEDRLRSELGRQIRSARTQRGWTLKELSEASGMSVSQLSSIERGSHLPSIESLVGIAGALGARASEWMAGAGF
jgi:DNA-binding NtrC family response regulator